MRSGPPRADLALAITGYGVSTSLGSSAAAACAAIRAGVSRPRRVRDVAALERDTEELAPLLAHPAELVTDGFYKIGRWLRLATDATNALLASDTAPPEGRREQNAVFLVAKALDEGFLETCDRTPRSLGEAPGYLRAALLEPLCASTGLILDDHRVYLAGAPGLAEAVSDAARFLREGRCHRVLILAVDSWLDPTLLSQAAEASRVRAHDQPMGFIPGEAAVAMWVEPEREARRLGRRAFGVVDSVALVRAEDDPITDPAKAARAVVAAVEATLPSEATGDLFLDLSGEEWRARQWGTALVSLASRLAATRVHTPAVCVGDVGAASSALGLVLACEALRRRWAQTDRALVLACDDAGQVGSIMLRRP